ncbi:MAG: alpha/beta hydrolase-fold protein [Blastocatellia bacterium]|nr:alpha/beta hydrolase-fold protein [Blastocatellia bacterium]
MQSNCSDSVAASAATPKEEPSAASPSPDRHTLTGEFRHHRNVASAILGNQRDVIVYLPPGYEREDARRYPVLYLNDGQNLFDRATSYAGVEWQVDETAQSLIEGGLIEPLIIVGIHNTGETRIDEYTPTIDPKLKRGGKAGLYGQFIVDELKPFIDRRYRTRVDPASTGIGGSSLGGLVSLYLGLKYPQIFGKLMVMSPSIWWDHGILLRTVETLPAKPSTHIWLDIGTREGKFTPGQVRTLKEILLAQGWRLNADLKYLEVKGGHHNEAAWAGRVAPALKFLFPKIETDLS